jgi:fimbrial chaperone protein
MKTTSRWGGLALALGFLAPCWAASLHVAPVSVQFSPGQQAATVSLRNDGDQTLRAQVRVFAWSQAGNEDKLDASQALVASPPQVEIAPKATQTVRLVRGAKGTPAGEESFRLLIDEIVDQSTAPPTGVSVQLRYSVPVFIAPAGMKPPKMTVTTNVDGANLVVKAQNSGGQHANISAVMLQGATGDAVVLEPGLLGYVLVGKTMEWKLPIPQGDSAKGPFTTMRCRFNGEDFSSKL